MDALSTRTLAPCQHVYWLMYADGLLGAQPHMCTRVPGEQPCGVSRMCTGCLANFRLGEWLDDADAVCSVLSTRLAPGGGPTVGPASVQDRAYCCMQMTAALGKHQVQPLDGGAPVPGWHVPEGSDRRILGGPLGDAYVAACAARLEWEAEKARQGDMQAHWALKQTIARRLRDAYQEFFFYECEPAVHLAMLDDLRTKPPALHRMQDYLMYLFSYELTTRLEYRVTRLCSATDLAAWQADPGAAACLRLHNWVSFADDGSVVYTIYWDKRANKRDPHNTRLVGKSYLLSTGRAPRLTKLLPRWRPLAGAAQAHLGYLEDGAINCVNAPFLFFACARPPVGGGEARLPLALPPRGTDRASHVRKLAGIVSNRLRVVQLAHSTDDERKAATGSIAGRNMGANSFRHARAEDEEGVHVAALAAASAHVQRFAEDRRTSVAMIHGVYAQRAAAAGAARAAAAAPAPAPAPASTSPATPPVPKRRCTSSE